MRAIRVATFGPPEVLQETVLPDPTPGPGQVLVEVSHIGVTFVETQVRAGRPPWNGNRPALPYIPGNAVEGRVVSVGPGGDDRLLGQRIVTSTGGSGGYATLVAAPAHSVIVVPEGLAPGAAVALLADGRTALALRRSAGIKPGESVIIAAAAGGVGSLLLQLAVHADAGNVIALVGGADKAAKVREYGPTATIDYLRPEWTRSLRDVIARDGLDVVFEGVGGRIGRALLDASPPRTRFCSFGMSSGSYTDASVRDIVLSGVTVIGGVQLGSPGESRELSAAALAEAAAGRLRPLTGQVFPLARAAEAHAAMENRSAIGKTLLICSPDLDAASGAGA